MVNDKMVNNLYPLYDVPYLVRDPNDNYMSAGRSRIRQFNQAVVDDYFIARNKGLSAESARKMAAQKHGIPTIRVYHCLRWFYQEAERRKKYDFLEKFSPDKEHIVHF